MCASTAGATARSEPGDERFSAASAGIAIPEWAARVRVMNREAEEWLARARTSETTARIRRWARRERIATRIMIASLIAVCAWPVAGVAHLVWTMVRGEEQSFAPWGWTFLALMVFVAIAVLLHSIAQHHRERAVYADGQISLGRVVEIITLPPDSDGFTTYRLMVSAELPGSVMLRREIREGHKRHAPDKWEGKAVRFRHNTLDPDDLQDILFTEFVDIDEVASS